MFKVCGITDLTNFANCFKFIISVYCLKFRALADLFILFQSLIKSTNFLGSDLQTKSPW